MIGLFDSRQPGLPISAGSDNCVFFVGVDRRSEFIPAIGKHGIGDRAEAFIAAVWYEWEGTQA